MTIRNRELSQFGSFIHVENSTQEIGITTGAFPYVGIGTTNPQYKLHVIGDTNISGVISATGFYLNGNSLVDASIQYWESSGSDVYRTSGSVGIGSTIPAYTLDVAGEIQATRFHSKQTTGTSPFVVQSQTLVANLNADLLDGKNAPSGEIVGTSDNQTLTTKTINLSSNTLSGTLTQFNTALSDDNFVSLTGSETLTNKTLTTPVISAISNSGIQTVPTGNGTLVSTNSVGVVTTGMIFDGTITNSDISASAAIAVSKLASSTISGVSLGSTLSTLTFNSTYLSGTSYNGSAAVTLTIKANSDGSDPTGFPVVARDATGSFSAGNSGTITAKDFNSTSDENLKTNIKTIENGLETVKSLRGVTFDWKIGGQPSVGVIAQELEKILPELVKTGDVKTVNYDGLVGVLIEAIKELSAEVEELKQQINK